MWQLNLMDDTVIAFCVDHGLNVGDHGLWDKRCVKHEANDLWGK